MTETTGQRVLSHLESYHLVRKGNGRWRCHSPLRPDSDSDSFSLMIDGDGESGAFKDWAGGSQGSLYDLAKLLNIPITPRDPNWVPAPRLAVEASRREYANLADYALFKGVPESAFLKANWKATNYQGRAALEYPTATGKRWRFIDGGKPKFTSARGYAACWYGLKHAVPMAAEKQLPLVICNGEPSVIVAQYFGVPACCITAGESQGVKPDKLAELLKVWEGEILIAFDCDEAGNAGALALTDALVTVGYYTRPIDLYLTDKGDLADVCKLHGDESMAYLQQCKRLHAKRSAVDPELSAPADDLPPLEPPAGWTETTALATPAQPVSERIWATYREVDEVFYREQFSLAPLRSKTILNPYSWLHHYGGVAHWMTPGNIMYIASISGGTKTTGIETAMTLLMEDGYSSIVYSPELIPRRSEDNRLMTRLGQRMGGIKSNRWAEHWAARSGEPSARLLTPEEAGKAEGIRTALLGMGALPYFIKGNPTVRQMVNQIPELMEQAESHGNRPEVFLIDYAQLFRTDKRADRNYIEDSMSELVDLMQAHGLKGIVTSQSNKRDAVDMATGDDFTTAQMQYLSDQQCQLMVAVAPAVDHSTKQRIYVGEGETLLRMRGKVLKNNGGRPSSEEFTFLFNANTLMWESESAL
jgi:hypothetical protein